MERPISLSGIQIFIVLLFSVAITSCGSNSSGGSAEKGGTCDEQSNASCPPVTDNLDFDKDGISDDSDNCPSIANSEQLDSDQDGSGDICDESPLGPDADLDGTPDLIDNCPKTENANQLDSDNDGVGDSCDESPLGPDEDNDDIADLIDNCPNHKNQDQSDLDNDDIGDACDETPLGPDADLDGVPDVNDNCTNIVNVDQLDSDQDGTGDSCDTSPFGPDIDNDGIGNLIDNCPDISNQNQSDLDNDNIGDACDELPLGEDTSAPTAKIVFPPKYSISKSNKVTIRGTASDSTHISSIVVNGKLASSTDQYLNWIVELELDQGLHEIVVSTSDSINTNPKSDAVEIHVTGPAITRPGDIAFNHEGDEIYWLDTFGPLLKSDLSGLNRQKVNINYGDLIISAPRALTINHRTNNAYISDSDQDSIFQLDLDTGNLSELSNCPDEVSFVTEIVIDYEEYRLLALNSAKKHVVAIDLNSGDCSVLFTKGSVMSGLAWNSNNNKIYYGSGTSLYSYDSETSTFETVTTASHGEHPGHVEHVTYHKDRNRIIWQASNDYYLHAFEAIYSLNPDNNELTVITDNEIDDKDAKLSYSTNMIISPDGNHLWMMARGNSSKLLSINLDSGEHRIAMQNLPPEKDQGTNLLYSEAIVTHDEHAYVIDGRKKVIFKISLNDGSKEIFLDQKTDFGILTNQIEDIKIDPISNDLYVMTDVDVIPETLYFNDYLPEFTKVDIETKQKTIVSSVREIGDEPDLHYADEFELDLKNNRILAQDWSPDEIVAIDIETGDRSIFSGKGIPDSDNEFSRVNVAALDIKGNRLLVNDFYFLSVDLNNGIRSVVSSLNDLRGILAMDNKNQRLFNLSESKIYQTNLNTMETKLISDWSNVDAPNRLASVNSFTYSEEKDMLYVTDPTGQLIYVVDPVSGARVILTN